jgi:hypothetical protein
MFWLTRFSFLLNGSGTKFLQFYVLLLLEMQKAEKVATASNFPATDQVNRPQGAPPLVGD